MLALYAGILCLIMAIDFYQNRDLLSPVLLILSNTVILFLIPAALKVWFHQPIAYLPPNIDHESVTRITALMLFGPSLAFGLSHLFFRSILKDIRIPHFEISFKSAFHFWSHQIIGLGSFFILLILIPHNIWGGGAYYNMAGFGVPHWIANIFLFAPAFLFLGVKEHTRWSYLALICSLILAVILLNRGTQSVYIVLCAFIVFREKFHLSLRTQLLVFLGIPTFVIVPKFIFIYFGDPTTFKHSLVWFLTYDLGRFDYLASAVYFKFNGLDINSLTAIRYIPFANYLPVIKD
jgi:hypothetical protein